MISTYSRKQRTGILQRSVLHQGLLKGIILILLITSLNVFSSQTRNFFYILSSPISLSVMWAEKGVGGFFSVFFDAKNLYQNNVQLTQENHNLISQVAQLQDRLKQEYDLGNALENAKVSKFSVLEAKIVGLNQQNDTVVLDKGTDDGVADNMPIISSQNVLFGRVNKAYKNFSDVLLISAKDSAVDVKVQNQDPSQKTVFGVLRGNGNLSVYLDLVSSDSQLNSGDILVTSALEGLFPADLSLGKITTVQKSDLKPFQTAEVQQFFNFYETDNLFVITNYNK